MQSIITQLRVKIPTSPLQSQLVDRKTKMMTQITFARITDSIYIGNSDFASNLKELKKQNITHILNCAPEECDIDYKYEDIVQYKLSMKEEDHNIDLFESISKILEVIEDIIENQRGKLLIFSQFGINRSPTIALAYLIHKKNVSLNNALSTLQQIYPKAEPTLDFEIQLKNYQEYEGNKQQQQQQSQINTGLQQPGESEQNFIKRMVDQDSEMDIQENYNQTLDQRYQQVLGLEEQLIQDSQIYPNFLKQQQEQEQKILDQKKLEILKKSVEMGLKMSNPSPQQISQLKADQTLLEQQQQLIQQRQKQQLDAQF